MEEKDIKDLSLHPGGTALTLEAYRTALFTTALYRDAASGQQKVKVQKFKAEKMKILDAGCGIGTSLAEIKKEYSVDAFGIDASEEAVAKAKMLHPDISFAVSDAACLPFNDGSFDGVLSECMLTLLEDPKAAVTEWSRVLKSGGFLIVSGLCEREGDDIQYSFRPEYPYDVNSSVICRNGLICRDAFRSFAQFKGLFNVSEKDCREELINYIAQSIMEYGSIEDRIKTERSETGSSVFDCSAVYDPKRVSYTVMIFKKS